MEETQITENPFLSEEIEPAFESDISTFESENSFSDEESFDFDSGSDSDSGSDFSTDTSFDSDTDFSNNEFTMDESEEDSSFTSEFETTDDPFSSSIEKETQNEIDEIEELPQFDQDLPSSPIEDTQVIEDFAPIEEMPVIEKTPLPQTEIAPSFSAPENFSDLKKFAESSSFTGMASEGNPSFSVLIKEIKYLEDAQDILTLTKELGLAMDSDEVLMTRLTRGEFLVPRISEYAATFLAHKLRRFDIDIMVGL